MLLQCFPANPHPLQLLEPLSISRGHRPQKFAFPIPALLPVRLSQKQVFKVRPVSGDHPLPVNTRFLSQPFVLSTFHSAKLPNHRMIRSRIHFIYRLRLRRRRGFIPYAEACASGDNFLNAEYRRFARAKIFLRLRYLMARTFHDLLRREYLCVLRVFRDFLRREYFRTLRDLLREYLCALRARRRLQPLRAAFACRRGAPFHAFLDRLRLLCLRDLRLYLREALRPYLRRPRLLFLLFRPASPPPLYPWYLDFLRQTRQAAFMLRPRLRILPMKTLAVWRLPPIFTVKGRLRAFLLIFLVPLLCRSENAAPETYFLRRRPHGLWTICNSGLFATGNFSPGNHNLFGATLKSGRKTGRRILSACKIGDAGSGPNGDLYS
jgi:hypothetical protein